MSRLVIYTAIFGGKDRLLEPEYTPQDTDFICFSDTEHNSSVWQVLPPKLDAPDPVRTARKHKILTHKLFPDHDYSIWIDGNIIVRGDVWKLIDEYLASTNMAVFDHAKTKGDARDCVYEEARVLNDMAASGKYKDDPALINAQIERYRDAGYPEHQGLLSSMVLLRKHNEPDVVKVTESWWHELEVGSRRDQLSFNYVAWKNNFSFAIIPEDSRDNPFFQMVQHAQKGYFDSQTSP